MGGNYVLERKSFLEMARCSEPGIPLVGNSFSDGTAPVLSALDVTGFCAGLADDAVDIDDDLFFDHDAPWKIAENGGQGSAG